MQANPYKPITLLVWCVVGLGSVMGQNPSYGGIKPPPPPQFEGFKPMVLPGTAPIPQMAPRPATKASQPTGSSRTDEWAVIKEEIRTTRPAIQYSLPSHASHPGAAAFHLALGEFREALEGSGAMPTKRAVFLSEGAYLGRALTYEAFCKRVDAELRWCKLALEGSGLGNSATAKRYILARYFSDTLRVSGMSHPPFRYDFNDPFGYKDPANLFVSKLLSTGGGQCHSLPLLYKILAEEWGIPAYLAFSPQHSYIRFPDERGRWHNFELTNGHLVSDAWIMASGYIGAEALRSGIYMDTVGYKGTMAYCLVDLAVAYRLRFGMDAFVEDCARLALLHDPDCLGAWLTLSDYQTVLTLHILKQVGEMPAIELARRYPKAHAAMEASYAIYDKVDAMGYRPMSEEDYAAWLKTGGGK